METALAVILALAIYVVVPVLIAFLVIGLGVRESRLARRSERARTMATTVDEADALTEVPAKV